MTPWTVVPPGSSVHRILQAGILEWVAMPNRRIELASLMSPALAGGFLTPSTTYVLGGGE